MADDDSKPSVPAWQRAAASPPPSVHAPQTGDATPAPKEAGETPTPEAHVADAPTDTSHAVESSADDGLLREYAVQFLQDPDIRYAPREKKVAFLETKGLSREEIEGLLNAEDELHEIEDADDPEAPILSSTPLPPTPSPAPSTSPAVASSQPRPQPPSQQQGLTSAHSLPKRDAPPVVTYPEFLVQPSKPPPLVTKSLLLDTTYIAAGLGAAMYALSQFVVAPMEASLTTARHDFLEHSVTRLEEVNTKLKNMVSAMPPSRPVTSGGDEDKDDVSISSDPTELYHRDIGVQTTPSLSRRGSISDASSAEGSDTLSAQEKQIKALREHIEGLTSSQKTTHYKELEELEQAGKLTSYLNTMTQSSSPYYNNYGNFWGGANGSGNLFKDDEIERFKGEIRSMKGVMLSSRNFPRGTVS
ncbi:hypothetical protein EJ06DRAFT_578234 [Trichodelitschia bisporula]|uniref:Peroxisomal membrane protein PEX14 n=1 Tax=Trichodelitschia bisporula TaxID=703511 RepID=A0A6G1IA53_9PEZI|nr:hypothetical protein EJ06DRAFT_578234 [Trichodelitschia bisporula]